MWSKKRNLAVISIKVFPNWITIFDGIHAFPWLLGPADATILAYEIPALLVSMLCMSTSKNGEVSKHYFLLILVAGRLRFGQWRRQRSKETEGKLESLKRKGNSTKIRILISLQTSQTVAAWVLNFFRVP